MCGFTAFFSSNILNIEQSDKMKLCNNIIKHRGPDDEGIYFNEHIFLGFRRLSLIDFENGKQPFPLDNEDYKLIFNGEIYNYLDLKKELETEGIEFSTNTEAEVILNLYKTHGKSFVEKLRGMFAFIIWDNKKKKILCARDPFGIKPFYYVDKEEGLYCASELKSILNKNIHLEKNILQDMLQNYLTFQYVPEPYTILENVKILPAGCTLEKTFGEPLNITPYYNLSFNTNHASKEDKIKNIRNALYNSVEKHMLSDFPVASFLSGGIDSSIVTLIASKINPKLKSFTVGFEVNGYSEVEYAKSTADFLGIENIHKFISCEEFIEELPKIIWHMDVPVADPSEIALYFIAKEASKHVRVILSGEGADELFGGYNIYNEPNSLRVFDHIPKFMKKFLKDFSHKLPEGTKGKSFLYRGCTPLEKRYFGNANIFKEPEKKILMNSYNEEFASEHFVNPFYRNVENLDCISKMQYIDLCTWLKGDILVKSDRMTMANSLELRVPFLDKEVFKISSSLGYEDKVYNGTTKHLLREAFKEDFPMDIINRRKLGYPVPIRVWLKNELYPWAISLIKESNTEKYINKNYAVKLLEEHRKGHLDNSRKIWTILIFMLWHKVFIEDNM